MTYAHVNTYRHGAPEEISSDVARWEETGEPVTDQTARTLASWWHSPAPSCRAITALSHGRPFDTNELRDEIPREITDATDAGALLAWLDALDEHLTGA